MAAVAVAKRPAPAGSLPPATKARVSKAPPATPATRVAVAKSAPPPVAQEEPASPSPPANEGIRRADTWRDFENVDPLYALIGECGQDRVMDADGNVRADTLARYLDILVLQKAAKKPKDWIEVWAAMDIPPDNQTVIMEPILSFGLQHGAEGFGQVLSALIMGHRVKTIAMTAAINGAFSGREDPHGILRDMLFNIFPKGPQSEWGWSRVGWSWQEWWKLVEKSYDCLAEASAFDELAALLDRIEAEGGKPLVEQTLQWSDKRLASARALLCKYSGLEDEADLVACCDATLI